MAAITGDFPPGPYTATWNGNSIGLMEGPIRHQQSIIALPVRASLYGQEIIDYILQGTGGVFAAFMLKEWNANVKAALWPYGSTQGITSQRGQLIGAGALAKSLVLTAMPLTPAATEGPVTRTYPLAILLPGHTLDYTLGPVERNIPVIMCALPESEVISTTTLGTKHFTDT